MDEIILVTNQDPIHVWSGGLDNILKSFDINSSTESAHGSHEGAIKCVEFSGECGLVVTGSWDSTVMLLLENLHFFKSARWDSVEIYQKDAAISRTSMIFFR